MKKLLYLIFLLPVFAFSDSFFIRNLSDGMWSNPSENKIPQGAAQLIQNFYTDIQPIAIERNGYEQKDLDPIGDSNAVTGLWEFVDNSGNEHIISFSSRTFYRNTSGNAPTAFGLVATVDQVPDCTVNLGRIWCVNGTDDLWWYDGSSTGTVSSAPKGRIIESWRNRIVIGDIPTARSTLRFSEDGDGESWTLGGNATSPFAIQIGGANDGMNITCVWGSYFDNLIIARKRDIWSVSGFDQNDVVTRNISSEIGCLEDGSMREFDGSLIFLSNRGIEEMRGIAISHISEPIRDITDSIVKNTTDERSNTQTTESDWNSGSFSDTIYVDTKTVEGSIQSLFPDGFSNIRDGTNGTETVWEEFENDGTVSISDNELVIDNDGNSTSGSGIVSKRKIEDFGNGATYYFEITELDAITDSLTPNAAGIQFHTSFSTNITRNPSAIFNPNHHLLNFVSSETGKAYVDLVKIDADELTDSGGDFDVYNGTDFDIPFSAQFYLSSSFFQLTVNGDIIFNGTHSSNRERLHFIIYSVRGSPEQGQAVFDNFAIIPQTFTFTSQVVDMGTEITSYGPLRINEDEPGDTIIYEFNASTSPNIASFNSSSWTTVVTGDTPTNGVERYSAFRATFTVVSTTSISSLQDFTIVWSEGEFQPLKSWEYDRRYWLSYTTSTQSGARNNKVLVYQRNRTWSLLDGINAVSFTTWRDRLYFGDSTDTGLVYLFDEGNDDNGSNIDARIITKSYDLEDFSLEKEFDQIYINYNGKLNQTGSFTLTYTLDQSTIPISLGTFNMNETLPSSAWKSGFPRSDTTQGREIQYTIRKNDTGNPLKLYDIKTVFRPKEPR